jgi:hypothetical protein
MKSDSEYAGQGNFPTSISGRSIREAIRQRAGEIYEKSGRVAGRDEENWARAEAEILSEHGGPADRKATIVIAIDGVQFAGEYSVAVADGYTPGEWRAGAPVPVRFEGERMFLRRRNGKELETRLVIKVS